MAITRGQVADALDANLNKMYQDGLTDWGEEYRKIFNVLNSDRQSEKDSYESGFVTMPEKDEGVTASYDTITPGISKTYTHLTYALGYEITEEAIEDNLQTPQTFNKLPQALNRSAIETVETVAANIVNTGLDGTTTGFDGVSLFSTAHPNLGGGTQSNRPTSATDLSVSSLTAGLTSIEKYTDEKGLKRPTKAVLLCVPADLWNIAEELLGSEYKPLNSDIAASTIRIKVCLN